MGLEVRMARPASTAFVLLLALAVGGCPLLSSLPEDLYAIHDLESCPELIERRLAEKARGFSHTTPSSQLRCALGQLRTARPLDIHETSVPAKICYLLADRHRNSADREQLAAEGVRWAEIALDGNPGRALYGIREDGTVEEGRASYYLAVNLGIAVRDHTTLAIQKLGTLAKELRNAVKLCPDEERGGPLRVLGMLYLVAPPWPDGIGDGDRALEILEWAVTQHPDHPLNNIFYAQALWEVEQEDAEEEVKKHLHRGNKLLDQSKWGGASDRWRKLLKELASEANVKLLPMEEKR